MSLIRKIYTFLIDTVQTLLIAASVFLVIYIFLFRPFQVNGASMFPTFEDKEYVLTDLITYKFTEPKKGSVIVFKAPNDPEKDFIKRVIATTGDTVFIRNGDVYLNGQKLDESPYLKSDVKTFGGAFFREDQPVTVPANSFVVFGDNRPYSSDSREWGFITKEHIIGKSLFVYWPVNRMRLIRTPKFNN